MPESSRPGDGKRVTAMDCHSRFLRPRLRMRERCRGMLRKGPKEHGPAVVGPRLFTIPAKSLRETPPTLQSTPVFRLPSLRSSQDRRQETHLTDVHPSCWCSLMPNEPYRGPTDSKPFIRHRDDNRDDELTGLFNGTFVDKARRTVER